MQRRVLFVALLLIVAGFLSPGPAFGRGGGAPTSSAIASPTAGAVPDTPVGRQLAWVLAALADGARALSAADITARFGPEFLAALPPEQAAAGTRQLATAYGPFTFEGFVRPATDIQAVALLSARTGDRLTVIISVEPVAPHRIRALTFQPAPPALDVATAKSPSPAGLFDVGGRRLYLACTGAAAGNGGPTVVLEAGHGGDSTVWLGIQSAVAPGSRVCAYDRANTPGGTSDPAPLPRTAEDAVADLHALLAAAKVPGPYVLVGHSLGGLFVRLYAGRYPDEVAGLVLVDPSHED